MHAPHMRHVNIKIIKTAQVSWVVGGPIPKQTVLTRDNSHCAFTIRQKRADGSCINHLGSWSGGREMGPIEWSPDLFTCLGGFLNRPVRNL